MPPAPVLIIALVLAPLAFVTWLLLRLSYMTAEIRELRQALRRLEQRRAKPEGPLVIEESPEPRDVAMEEPDAEPLTELAAELAAEPAPGPAHESASDPGAPTSSRAAVKSGMNRPAAPRRPAKKSFDWERWLGVRGAAVVGGIALVLAGIFFVQVAIQRGWLGPAARDGLAFGLGALCLLAHGPLRRARFVPLADSLAGAGTVLAYGACWAAARLHDLVPTWLALVVMACVTAISLGLAARTGAALLAAFAIIGGFATPILLDTTSDSTAVLFGYVLVLDACVLLLARARRWSLAALAATVGTAVLQVTWADARSWQVDPWTTLIILGGSSPLLAAGLLGLRFSKKDAPAEANVPAPLYAAAAMLVVSPLLIALRLGLSPRDSGPLSAGLNDVWPAAALCAMLAVAAGALARSKRFQPASFGLLAAVAVGSVLLLALETLAAGHWRTWAAASASVGLVLAAFARGPVERIAPLLLVLLSLALATPLAVQSGATVDGQVRNALSGSDFTTGVAALLGVALLGGPRRWEGAFGGLLGALAGGALMTFAHAVGPVLDLGAPIARAPAVVGLGLVALAVIVRRLERGTMRTAATAAAFVPLAAIVALSEQPPTTGTALFASMFAVVSALGIVLRGRITPVSALAALGLASAIAVLLLNWSGTPGDFEAPSVAASALILVAVVPLVAWLCASADDSRTSRRAVAWFAALPAAVLIATPTHVVRAWAAAIDLAPDRAEEGLLVAGALVLAGCAYGLRRRSGDAASAAAPATVAAALASLALAKAFSEQWTTVAAVLAAGSAALIGARARTESQRGLATGIAAIGVLVLLAITFLARAFAAESFFLPIHLTIDYALAGLGLTLAALGHRAGSPEPGRSAGRIILTASALALTFGWVNAAVLNRYAVGEEIAIDLERSQSRDLTLSLAWAIFAGILLALGLARRNAGLRWTSLFVFVATILKVFLYDLGALSGLPRVGSFLGLAVALLGVSVVYTRVLGRENEDGDTLAGDEYAPPHPDRTD